MSEYIENLIIERPATDIQKYMILGRMQRDCEYYLEFGFRDKEILWSHDEKEQIENMKALWNSFPDGKKPEWLTMEQIEEYEKQMIK